MPYQIDHKALVLAALDAAATAESMDDRKRHLNKAAIHATDGERARNAISLDAPDGEARAASMTEDEALNRSAPLDVLTGPAC